MKFTFEQLEEEFALTSEEEIRAIKGGYGYGFDYNQFGGGPAPDGTQFNAAGVPTYLTGFAADWANAMGGGSNFGTGSNNNTYYQSYTIANASNATVVENKWSNVINQLYTGQFNDLPAGSYRKGIDGNLIYTTPASGTAYGFGITTAGTYSIDNTGKATFISNELVKTDQYGHKFYSYDGGKTWHNIQDVVVSAKMKDSNNILGIQDNTKNYILIDNKYYGLGTNTHIGYTNPISGAIMPKLMAYTSYDDASLTWSFITQDAGLLAQAGSMRVNNSTNVVLDTKTGVYSANISLAVVPPALFTNPDVGANVDVFLNGNKIGSYSLSKPTGETISEKGTMPLVGTFNLPPGTTSGTLEFKLKVGATENLFQGSSPVWKTTSYTVNF